MLDNLYSEEDLFCLFTQFLLSNCKRICYRTSNTLEILQLHPLNSSPAVKTSLIVLELGGAQYCYDEDSLVTQLVFFNTRPFSTTNAPI